MKTMNAKKKYQAVDLQLFAEDGEDGPGDNSSGDDDAPEDSEDEDDGDDDPEEKRYSQKDIDEAVKKRLAREKRKWQREQQKAGEKKPDGKGKAGDGGNEKEDEETEKLRDKAARADEMELKWTCLEHDVDKSSVDDVLALARVHMAKDEDLDIEDAIDKVLKKYPQFKVGSSEEEEDDADRKKSWGQRQSGQRKKTSGVEEAFLKRNPGLKID